MCEGMIALQDYSRKMIAVHKDDEIGLFNDPLHVQLVAVIL